MAIALALPESGYLVACERDAKALAVAKRYYELAGVADKVIHFFCIHENQDKNLSWTSLSRGEQLLIGIIGEVGLH